MIVDNKEVTTEVVDTEMCSSACDVVMETCSSENHGTLRKCREIGKKIVCFSLKMPNVLFGA